MNRLQATKAKRLAIEIAKGKLSKEKGKQTSSASSKPKGLGLSGAASTFQSHKRPVESQGADGLKKSKKDVAAS